MRRTWLCSTLLLGATALGCGLPDSEYFGPVPEVRDPKHLRWCNSGEPESMDPAMASTTTAMKLLYSMFDGLMVYDENGLPTPSLAERYEFGDDLRRFTFYMHDKGRWSNGRPVTAYDVAYQALRTVHPVVASPNADGLVVLKNQEAFTGSKVKVLMRDAGGLPAGTVVELIGAGGKTLEDIDKAKGDVPNSNIRRASRPLFLRDLGATPDKSYQQVSVGSEVNIIAISGREATYPSPLDLSPWAYVHYAEVGLAGIYGWVPLTDLDVEPNAAVVYDVKPLPKRRVPGDNSTPEQLAVDDKLERATVKVTGADLLQLPELLGIRTPDAYTVVFETASPTPFFLNITNNRSLRPTPIEAVSRDPKRWAEPGKIITSGAMTMTVWKERDYIELVRSPSYWNQAEVKLDKLTAFSLEEQATTANYYYTGGCDATTSNNVPASYIPLLSGERRGGLEKRYKDFYMEPYLGTYFAFLNTEKLNNVHLRRALAYATDRTPLANITKGGEFPHSAYSPGTPISKLSDENLALCGVTRDTPGTAMLMITGELCYVPPPGLAYDPEKARAELEIARKEMGAKFPKEIVYKFNTGSEAHKMIAEYLQAQWSKVLGIPIKLETQEWKVFVNDTREGNYEVARFGIIGNFPDAEGEFLPNFRCASPDNRAKWCNQDFEKALNDAQPILDRKERLKKVYEAERIMLEDVPVIPLYVYTQKHLKRPYVKDLFINLNDQPSMHRVYLDPNWEATAGQEEAK